MEGRIETTVTRAKELRPFAERLVTAGKGSDAVMALRTITGKMGGQGDVARKIVKEIAPNYKGRNGGYTRILKLPNRASDNAPMALIEFV
jgi:large subunit ribosomal protein L17